MELAVPDLSHQEKSSYIQKLKLDCETTEDILNRIKNIYDDYAVSCREKKFSLKEACEIYNIFIRESTLVTTELTYCLEYNKQKFSEIFPDRSADILKLLIIPQYRTTAISLKKLHSMSMEINTLIEQFKTVKDTLRLSIR